MSSSASLSAVVSRYSQCELVLHWSRLYSRSLLSKPGSMRASCQVTTSPRSPILAWRFTSRTAGFPPRMTGNQSDGSVSTVGAFSAGNGFCRNVGESAGDAASSSPSSCPSATIFIPTP